MPSDLERAIRWSKRFESLLEHRHGARGKGLHQKIDSVESDLDPGVVRSLRLVATVRNKIVHEDGYDRIDDRKRFRAACAHAHRALAGKRRVRAALLAIGAFLLAMVGVLLVLSGRAPLAIF